MYNRLISVGKERQVYSRQLHLDVYVSEREREGERERERERERGRERECVCVCVVHNSNTKLFLKHVYEIHVIWAHIHFHKFTQLLVILTDQTQALKLTII